MTDPACKPNDWAAKLQWADEDQGGTDGWDQETGAPTLGLMSRAVQCWSLLQNRPDVTVQQAAEAFNVPVVTIVAAVEEHPWMLLNGLNIEHEGE